MKKFVFMALAALLSLALIVPSFAAADFDDPRFDRPNETILHQSYDEVRTGIVCAEKDENIKTPHIASGEKTATFWGWIAATKDIVGFTYSVNGGEVADAGAGAVVDAEQPVWDSATNPERPYDVATVADVSRFLVVVPVSEGTQFVRLYAEFADGTHELFWPAELTVGDETSYNDLGDTYSVAADPGDDNTDPGDDNTDPGDTTEPGDDNNTPGDDNNTPGDDNNKPGNTNTADGFSVIFMIAAAAMAVTVAMKKKAY